jgi:hypothetical protein
MADTDSSAWTSRYDQQQAILPIFNRVDSEHLLPLALNRVALQLEAAIEDCLGRKWWC